MKTDKFESTIRRKLESIQPDFQEADWAKMQNYMHAQTAPTFWQQYGSWIGYAAAASVSTVMAFLYVNQLSKNDHLESDLRGLKTQIEVMQQKPAQLASRTDTIFIVQTLPAEERIVYRNAPTNAHLKAYSKQSRLAIAENAANPEAKLNPNSGENLAYEATNSDNNISASVATTESGTRYNYGDLEYQEPVNIESEGTTSRKMRYTLANRISTRQIQRLIAQSQPQKPVSAQNQLAANADKKVEQTAKAENVIPKFNIKAPYRVGGGIQLDANGQTKSIVGEVIIAKKFSLATGISWLKVKPMEFFNEKMFKEKVRRDFKRSHPGEVPLALDVYNIKVKPTLVQIPLTVAFRDEIKDNWAYYASAGTNLNISSREKVSYDCFGPNKQIFNQDFDKKAKTSVINSVNVSVGLEKQFHPIVMQAEGFVYTYFNPLTPLSKKAGPGVRFKLLYQIGGKM